MNKLRVDKLESVPKIAAIVAWFGSHHVFRNSAV